MSLQHQLPSPPSGRVPTFGDMLKWAIALTAYLKRAEASAASSPKTILLEGYTATAKATVDGMLMFDPATGSPVISVGGVWKHLQVIP